MAPPSKDLQEAPVTNASSPGPTSGVLTPNTASTSHWTPETELSKLARRPETDTSSPIPFFHLLERLKTTKREGWRRFGINHGESISDHMYRMSLITMLCPPDLATRLDLNRCTRMALIHDMAEALVGDITPMDNVAKDEKSRREAETMDYIAESLLGKVAGGKQGEEIKKVWWEYEKDETEEAHFVHDVDKMELLLQMVEYERSGEGKLDLGEFSRVAVRIKLPEVQAWAQQVLDEREAFWKEKGVVPTHMEDVKDGMKKLQDEYYGTTANGHSDVKD